MASIAVAHEQGDVYVVTVSEGDGSTTHHVTVTPDDLRRLGGDATAERLLEASFEFLLEREPKESILRSFDITIIGRYFPEYPAQIRKRL